MDFIKIGLHTWLDRLHYIFFFSLLDSDSSCYLSPIAFPHNFVGDLIGSLVKGTLGGRKKGNDIIMVSDDVFFIKVMISGEKGGILCQGLVWEVAKGLIGSGGRNRDAKVTIC